MCNLKVNFFVTGREVITQPNISLYIGTFPRALEEQYANTSEKIT